MKTIIILLLTIILPVKLSSHRVKTDREQVIVYGKYIQSNSTYLFGQSTPFSTQSPSHPNYGLSKSWHNTNGWDIFVEPGTPVYSLFDGEVISCKFRENGKTVWGYGVTISGLNRKVFYTHMDEVTVCQGDVVRKGQLIGYIGQWPEYYCLRGGEHIPSHLHIALSQGRLNEYLNDSLRLIWRLSDKSVPQLVGA